MKKYNVFISCKSEDYSKAESIYNWLIDVGYQPFFAPITLKISSTPGEPVVFGDEIDDALEQADSMIVFTSKAEYVKTGYVKDEWRTFVEEQRAGRKSGFLLTILDGVKVDDLPIRLRSVQSFNLLDYKEGVLRFLGKAIFQNETKRVAVERQSENNRIYIEEVKQYTEVAANKERKNLVFTVNGVSFKMIYVRGGTFMMGATPEQGKDAEDNENPVHQVTLSDYFIGETQVTQSLWKAVMGTNPSYFKGDDLPVEEVSWNDCQIFIQKLNALTGKTFHLPTEAEWEYAARGGDKCQNFKYAGGNTIGDVAWYKDNCDDKAHSVKGKRPNELGLYDMSGNVWEWCEDRYDNYNVSNQNDPKGPLFGLDHLLRGGSRNDRARNCRVSKRFLRPGGHPDRYIGMRLALEKEQEDETKTFNVGEVEFKMIRVSGGTFRMGAQSKDPNADNYDTEAYDDESPVHDVKLSDYFIAETEVTQALWKEVMGTEPLYDGGWKEKLGRGDSHPVYWVSWNDCQYFIRKLNAKTGQTFRLPTEAEWEFAARGGNKSRGFKYAGGNMLDDVAWYSDNSDSRTHPVKGKQPNELKLYDMSGNVWEWCQDIYPMGDYSISQSDISSCKAEGLNRVLRGGSWDDYPRGCRVAVRGNGVDGCPYVNHGLRLAM